MKKQKITRICHCNNDNKNGGGAYIITRRVEKVLREDGYIFDYLTMDEFIVTGNPEIDLLPDSAGYSARLRKNRWIGHIKLPFYAYSIFKKNRYPIVHIDIDLAGKALLYAIPAKLAGAKVVIHSHSSGIDGDHKKLKALAHSICKQILPIFTDKSVACSKAAGQWLFPRRAQERTVLLLNGTDFNRFYYDAKLRQTYRKKMGLRNKLIIGNIGNVCQNKNQIFLVNILRELVQREIDSVLLIVGSCTSEMRQMIQNVAQQFGLADRVLLLGVRSDTNALLNAMDIYICPSFFEGAPLTLYEAQATGLPCVVSDTVSDEVNASEWIGKLPLHEGAGGWADLTASTAERFARDRAQRKLPGQYSLQCMAERLRGIYGQLLG